MLMVDLQLPCQNCASKCDSFTYSLTFLLLLACKRHLKAKQLLTAFLHLCNLSGVSPFLGFWKEDFGSRGRLRVSGDVQLWPKLHRIRLFKRLTRDLQEKTYVEKSKCVRALHNLGCLSTISFTTRTPGFVWIGGGDPCRLTLTRPYNCPLSLWTFIFQPAADLGLSDTLQGSSSAVGRLFELWCVTLCRAQGQDFELVQKEMTDFKKSFRQCSKPLTIHCIVQYTVDMPFLSYASAG